MTGFLSLLGQCVTWLLVAAVSLCGTYIVTFVGYLGCESAEDYLKRQRSQAYIEGKLYNG